MNDRETFQISYHVVCLLDVLGQKSRLAGWGDLPIDGGLTETHVQGLKDTLGVVLVLQSAFEKYFEQVGRCTMPEEYTRLTENQRDLYRRYKECRLGIQQFSDTFVFYAPIPNDYGDASVAPLYLMIGACCVAMLFSLAARTPVRGAVAIGAGAELAERNFYGPALAEAHYLESTVAQYPRIVVSPRVDDFLNTVRSSAKSGRFSEIMRQLAAVCSSMLVADDDGRRIVDYLGEGVRKLLAVDAASSEAVRLGHDFACAEAERFREKGDQKLAERYDRLRRYMEPRLRIWSQVGQVDDLP